MEQQVLPPTPSPYRSAGWAAIASGTVGLIAFALLITAVTSRSSWILDSRVYLLFRAHDIGVVLQFLLMIPVALGLRRLSLTSRRPITAATLATGIGAILFVVLLLLLGMGKIVSDMFYMLPLGVFGVWLIVILWRLAETLPRWLRYFGIVVGLGLALVGTVFPGLVLFVYPEMIRIPAVPEAGTAHQDTLINTVIHVILNIGSLMGVITLPVWTALLGFRFLKRKYVAPPSTANVLAKF